MNLFKDIRNNYGQTTVKTIRDYENNEQKVARHRNHLVFTLRCKDESLIPPSLKLKCPIKSSNAKRIVEKAQKDLVRERIRVINNKIKNLKQKSADQNERIRKCV